MTSNEVKKMAIEQEIKICNYLLDGKEYDIFSLLREWEKDGENIDYSKGYEYSNAAYNLAVNGYLAERENKIDVVYGEKVFIKKYRITAKGKTCFKENYYNYAVDLYRSNKNDSTVLESVKKVLHTYFPKYKDSEKLQQEIANKQKEIANNRIYDNGVYLLNEMKDYDMAIESFKKIPGWKDTDKLIVECKKQKREKEKNEMMKGMIKVALYVIAILIILGSILLCNGFFD